MTAPWRSRQRYGVHLVERTEVLGATCRTCITSQRNTTRAAGGLINRVRAHSRIVSMTRTELVRHEGHVGNFRSTLRTTARWHVETFTLEHGVTIVATGGGNYANTPGSACQCDHSAGIGGEDHHHPRKSPR